MYVSWLGQSCFKIQGQEVSIIIDPFEESIGLKLPRLTADIVTVSHDHFDHNNVAAVKGTTTPQPFIINQPGEYEIKNVFIHGFPSWHDDQEGKERGKNTIFRVELEGLNLLHLGDLGHLLSNGQLDELGEIDILMIPVGGTYTIDAKQAVQLISQIEPRIIIPMHYKIKGLKADLAPLDKFCQEMGICPKETINKLKIAKKDLLAEEMKIIILEP